MSGNSIEPQQVIERVEYYVRRELNDFEQYENRKPFDESGVWSLHQLARDVYALGVADGCNQEMLRFSGQQARDRKTAESRGGAE